MSWKDFEHFFTEMDVCDAATVDQTSIFNVFEFIPLDIILYIGLLVAMFVLPVRWLLQDPKGRADAEALLAKVPGWQREFDTIDGDGDRKLTWKECKAKGMLEKTFKLADADGNGYIDLAEYEAWFTVRQYQKSCRAMFTRLEERIEEHAAKDPPEPLPADDKAEAKEFVNRIRSELEKTVAHAEGDVRKLLTAHAERDVRKRLRQLESLTR